MRAIASAATLALLLAIGVETQADDDATADLFDIVGSAVFDLAFEPLTVTPSALSALPEATADAADAGEAVFNTHKNVTDADLDAPTNDW